MTKKEKIIYALDCCSWGIKCSFCPYNDEPECKTVLMCDILNLFKEQENSIEPKTSKNDDYIKRSNALEIATEWCPDDDGSIGKIGDLREMLDELESIPTADVAPVRHGRWIDAYPQKEQNLMFNYGTCSICEFEQSISNKLNFCPNCGAKMDKEE